MSQRFAVQAALFVHPKRLSPVAAAPTLDPVREYPRWRPPEARRRPQWRRDSESASRQPHDQLILVLSVRFYQLTKTATNFKVARIRKWQLIILIDLDI